MRRMAWVSALLVGLVGWACSEDESQSLPATGDSCPSVGLITCGLGAGGAEAVLRCSEAQSWMTAELCAYKCVVSRAEGALCFGGGTDDALDGGLNEAGGDGSPEAAADQTGEGGAGGDLLDVAEALIEGEVHFPELIPDFEPPWVASTSPAADQMGVAIPLEIKVTFTESIHDKTIAVGKTVRLLDAGGKDVPLEEPKFVDEDKTVLLLKPSGAIFNSSPYTVRLDPMIKDLAGNMMNATFEFTFYTAAISTLTFYQQLAGQFAPLIYQATNAEAPQYDYLARYDLDGDWVAEDNVDYIKKDAVKVEPYVYYSVAETKSHFFITYVFYYPFRYTESESARFGNDISGATVLVRKEGTIPVAVETYFKTGEDERSHAFVIAEDSGLILPGTSYSDFKFKGQYASSDLFPNGHFVSYLSARNHESCLWLDEGNSGILDKCKLNAGIKAQLTKIAYKHTDGAAQAIGKEGGGFPASKENVGYGLLHVLAEWWPRRADVGPDKMWASTYEYLPHESSVFKDRPSLAHAIPAMFVNPVEMNDNGYPPWAWKWAPKDASGSYDINRGVWFLDPAVHFKQRHDQGNKWPGYDAQSKSGWSLDYCFNPYFHIDNRIPWGGECSPPQ